MSSFLQLFKANLKIVYRNRSGAFWTLVLPSFIYIALSVLPVGKNVDDGLNYSNFILPGIVAMAVMQSGIYSLAYWLVDLKSRGVIKRFLATPLKMWQMALSVVAARLIIILTQAVFLTLLGVIFFKADFVGNFLSVLVLVLLGGGIFLCIGLLVSQLANSYESAAPITSAIGLPLTFLGNIFFPTDNLPNVLRIISELLPITYLADGLRQAYLYPFNFDLLAKDFLALSIWLAVVMLITIKTFRLKE